MATTVTKGTFGPNRKRIPPSAGPTRPAELSTASITPNRPPTLREEKRRGEQSRRERKRGKQNGRRGNRREEKR